MLHREKIYCLFQDTMQNTQIPCDHNVEFLKSNLVVRKITGKLWNVKNEENPVFFKREIHLNILYKFGSYVTLSKPPPPHTLTHTHTPLHFSKKDLTA